MHSSSDASSTRRSRGLELRPLVPADREPIARLLRDTGAFSEEEIVVALELIDAPESAGYRFAVAVRDERVVGYACWGSTPLTDRVYDLYWIAVDPTAQGAGVGRSLLEVAESAVRSERGRMLLIETASKPSYDKTRAFYLKCEYVEVARIPDFYREGDDKVVYAKRWGVNS
jgi:ribosomal protein S18 acetylase RimI-like enzyme